jgi:hypothetical protein
MRAAEKSGIVAERDERRSSPAATAARIVDAFADRPVVDDIAERAVAAILAVLAVGGLDPVDMIAVAERCTGIRPDIEARPVRDRLGEQPVLEAAGFVAT